MINIKLDDSHISINDNCRSKKSILEKLSQLLSKSSGINVNEKGNSPFSLKQVLSKR